MQSLMPSRSLILWMFIGILAISAGSSARAGKLEPAPGSPTRIALWPSGLVPGDKPLAEPAQIAERSNNPALPDRYITHVSKPYMVVYRPHHPNGVGLLVLPGGGYQRVVLDKEGTALVPDFVKQGGITLFVLRYRLPGEGRADREASLADAQRALRLIRSHAAKWKLDPRRIGVMGFSAGGHLAARLGTGFDKQVYPVTDAVDRVSAQPDFELLIYPVIDMAEPYANVDSREHLLGKHPGPRLLHRYSMQYQVRSDTPPTFLVHAQDDRSAPVNNSLLFYRALLRAGVSAEMHLFPYGGHGFGVRGIHGLTTAAWPRLARAWIASQPEGPSP